MVYYTVLVFFFLAYFTLYNRLQFHLLDSVGEGKGRMIWENGIETCILSYVKQIASPGSMNEMVEKGMTEDEMVGWHH